MTDEAEREDAAGEEGVGFCCGFWGGRVVVWGVGEEVHGFWVGVDIILVWGIRTGHFGKGGWITWGGCTCWLDEVRIGFAGRERELSVFD